MTREQIVERVRMSRACTVVAAAFRRALGLPEPRGGGDAATHADHGVYGGMAECFANRVRVDLGDRS